MRSMSARRRRAVVAASVASALALAAACSSDGDSEGSGEPLQFFLSGDANQGGGYAHMAAKYEEETGVVIEIVDIANADLSTRLRNAAQANDLPDIARPGGIDPVWIDSTVDLASIVEGSDIRTDVATIEDDGKVVSIPSDITAVGLFINKSLFDEAGVDYPTSYDEAWTWDEFVASVREVQEATGTSYGMVMDSSLHRLKAFFYQFGSDWWQPQEDGEWSTNDATQVALEYLYDLNDDDFMPRSVWLSDGDPNALFKSGDVVSYLSGSWQIADFAVNIADFEWASVYLPYQEVQTTNFGNAANVVVFEGPNQDAAVEFIDWLYEPENYAELSQVSGFLPAIDGLEVDYTEHADAFNLYNEEISASAPVVSDILRIEFAYRAAGVDTNDSPMREEIIRFLNNEQDAETTIQAISDERTDFVGPLP